VFTESTGNKIAKISPSSGKITEYNIATQMAAVDGIAAGPTATSGSPNT